MKAKHSHLIGNKHGCKKYPRDAVWSQRANTGVKSLAMKQAKLLGISTADYLEMLVIKDLKSSHTS